MERNNFLEIFEPKLAKAIEEYKNDKQTRLYEMLNYTLFPAGKRIRPYLVFLGAEFAKGGELTEEELESVLNLGVCVELIHNYSLVHDDLPAMDNDEYRRGRLTVHKAFSEWEAILVGDELLNLAYEKLLSFCAHGNREMAKAGNYLAMQAGGKGMIKGQLLDLSGIKDINNLIQTNLYKTAYLLRGALISGAILLKADKEMIEALDEYALNLGLAFQIADDILDKDNIENSILRFIHEEKAQEMVIELTNKAINALESYKVRSMSLQKLAMMLATRKN